MQITKNTMRFESMADLGAYMTPDKCHRSDFSGEWVGYVSSKQALAMLATGDESRVDAAQALLDKFDVHIETSGQAMATGVAGFCPSVPDYLGGSPESMYCMTEVQSEAAPLTIIVDLATSSSIGQDTITRRGTTILAAVMALSATRPVTLEVISMGDGKHTVKGTSVSISRVAINSTPLDLASACYALCHSGFCRHILYGVMDCLGFTGLWPEHKGKRMTATRGAEYTTWALDVLDADPETTLFIPAICSTDELVNEPERWIASVLAKYGQTQLM